MHKVLMPARGIEEIRDKAESMLTDEDAKDCQTGRFRQAIVKTTHL